LGKSRNVDRAARPARALRLDPFVTIDGQSHVPRQYRGAMAVEASRPEPLRFFVLSASLRRESLNERFARRAAQCFSANGGDVDLSSLADFEMPLYDQDIQDGEGYPPGAEALRQAIEAHEGFVIVSPEYNGSMPGALKNAIDWLSRFRPQPFNERQCLLLSASPSMAGGNRGLWALRVPLEHLGTRVYPDMFSLAQAHKAMDHDGEIINSELRARLDDTIVAFMDLVEAATHYRCVKRAWVEFLGEQPDPAVDRVDA
jgi:chromate reductase, NAD(P)H dehydrogenase (quinone)